MTPDRNRAQEWWDGLSPEERDRVAAYYDRTAREAFDYCCSILIGCPHVPTSKPLSATGVFVCVDDHHYVITADHVVTDGRKLKLAEEVPFHFQVGHLVMDPNARTVFADSAQDVRVLAIDPCEITKVGRAAYCPVGDWPPSLPQEDELVQLTGFAARNREDGHGGTINSYSLHLFGKVMNPRDTSFWAMIVRDGVPTENADLVPAPGESPGPGGMSGGPVFGFSEGPLPLLGIISQMSDMLDGVKVSSLCGVRIPPRPLICT